MFARWFRGVFLACLSGSLVAAGPVHASGSASGEIPESCRTPGIWLDPVTRTELSYTAVLEGLAAKDIVLLGEIHTNAEHHRWQLHTLAGLLARRSEVAIGFEMFPRSVQPALDEWPRGELSEKAFLESARWREVWGTDPALYLPLFHFARLHRLPMVALNVERGLVSRVGAEGWQAVPAEAKEGLSRPAPASEAYRTSLAGVYGGKLKYAAAHGGNAGGEKPALSEILALPAFQRFVEAQLTWDRAMAEAIAARRSASPEALVVGILGGGHIEHGHGVPHQLADLGHDGAAVLLPITVGEACAALEPGIANAVFLVPPAELQSQARPRLGVSIEAAGGGVRILEISQGSVAEATGLAAGDLIVGAAGANVTDTGALIDIIQRQAPGTWLPLRVRRGDEEREFVAKFPASFE